MQKLETIRRRSRLGRVARGLAGGALLGVLAGAPAAAEGAAEVVTRVGAVQAEGADGALRALECGDFVQTGERVLVGPGGGVGLLAGEVYARLEGSSAARWGAGPGAVPGLALEAGRARLIDAREPGDEPLRLATPHAEARGAGTDSEAYVLAEKTGSYSIVCEWEAPLEVSRDGESRRAAPGECVVARSREPLYGAPAQAERIAMGPDVCAAGPVLGALPERFDARDVAAGPPPALLLPPSPPVFGRSPCDVPGSGCAGGFGAGGGSPAIGVIESPVRPGGGD